MSININDVKAMYLQHLVGTVTDDTVLGHLRDAVVATAIDYLGDEDITTEDDLPDVVVYKLLKQIAHEYSSRRNIGVMSITAPDGTLSKMDVEEWLSDVKKVLIRHRITEF